MIKSWLAMLMVTIGKAVINGISQYKPGENPVIVTGGLQDQEAVEDFVDDLAETIELDSKIGEFLTDEELERLKWRK